MRNAKGVIVVGANLAGARLAAALRRAGWAESITLLGAEAHPPYERPPLSKAVTAVPALVPLFPAGFYETNDITLRMGVRVERIERSRGAVILPGGEEIAGRHVALCTGGEARRLRVPGAELDGVHVLRTLDDAAALATRLERGAPLVVVGGGLLGAEVVAAASASDVAVTWLETRSSFLEHALPAPVARRIVEAARAAGVVMLSDISVSHIEGDRDVSAVVLTDGRRLPARAVLVAIGITPNDALAHAAGIETADGVVVDGAGRSSVPGIWAAGDVARRTPSPGANAMRTEHWQAAEEQAATVACAIVGRPPPPQSAPWFWSDLSFREGPIHVEVAGRFASHDALVTRATELSTSVFALRDRRMVGAASIGRSRDMQAATRLIEAAVEVDEATLADLSADLAQLARAARPRPPT